MLEARGLGTTPEHGRYNGASGRYGIDDQTFVMDRFAIGIHLLTTGPMNTVEIAPIVSRDHERNGSYRRFELLSAVYAGYFHSGIVGRLIALISIIPEENLVAHHPQGTKKEPQLGIAAAQPTKNRV